MTFHFAVSLSGNGLSPFPQSCCCGSDVNEVHSASPRHLPRQSCCFHQLMKAWDFVFDCCSEPHHCQDHSTSGAEHFFSETQQQVMFSLSWRGRHRHEEARNRQGTWMHVNCHLNWPTPNCWDDCGSRWILNSPSAGGYARLPAEGRCSASASWCARVGHPWRRPCWGCWSCGGSGWTWSPSCCRQHCGSGPWRGWLSPLECWSSSPCWCQGRTHVGGSPTQVLTRQPLFSRKIRVTLFQPTNVKSKTNPQKSPALPLSPLVPDADLCHA